MQKLKYSSPYIRSSGDVDLLIDRNNSDTVKQIFLDNGFVQGHIADNQIVPFTRAEKIFQASHSHQLAPFVKVTGNKLCPFVNYDINMNIYWSEYDNICDMKYVLRDTEQIELCGEQVKKLPPEMEFISLCLHHYKDMNSIYMLYMGSLKLNLFCDIYYYIKNVRFNLDKLYNESISTGALPYVYYCLRYTKEIFADDILTPYIDRLSSSEGKALLTMFGLNKSEQREWSVDFKELLLSEEFNNYYKTLLTENDMKKITANVKYM